MGIFGASLLLLALSAALAVDNGVGRTPAMGGLFWVRYWALHALHACVRALLLCARARACPTAPHTCVIHSRHAIHQGAEEREEPCLQRALCVHTAHGASRCLQHTVQQQQQHAKTGNNLPAGWNSWNHFRCAIDEELIKEVRSGWGQGCARPKGACSCWALGLQGTRRGAQAAPTRRTQHRTGRGHPGSIRLERRRVRGLLDSSGG